MFAPCPVKSLISLIIIVVKGNSVIKLCSGLQHHNEGGLHDIPLKI